MKIMKRFFGRSGKSAKTEPSKKEFDTAPIRYESEQKPLVCPQCSASTIARIQYGLPVFSDELTEKIKNKELVLGGCIVTGSNPSWKCTNCEAFIHRPSSVAAN